MGEGSVPDVRGPNRESYGTTYFHSEVGVRDSGLAQIGVLPDTDEKLCGLPLGTEASVSYQGG